MKNTLNQDMQTACQNMLEAARFNGLLEQAKLWERHLQWLKENETATIQDAAANMDELGLP